MVTDMLTFTGAQKHDPRIAEWIADHQAESGRLAAFWYNRIRTQCPDAVELLHDGYPTLCMREYPFAYVGAFKAHANVGFFYGADLPDPNAVLEGSGKRMRHVKLRVGADVDMDALDALIVAAHQDINKRINERFPGWQN